MPYDRNKDIAEALNATNDLYVKGEASTDDYLLIIEAARIAKNKSLELLALSYRGLAYLHEGKMGLAYADLHAGTDTNFGDDISAEAWNNLGAYYLYAERNTGFAEKFIEKALELDNEFANAHFNLGMTKLKQNQDAVAHFETAALKMPVMSQIKLGFKSATHVPTDLILFNHYVRDKSVDELITDLIACDRNDDAVSVRNLYLHFAKNYSFSLIPLHLRENFLQAITNRNAELQDLPKNWLKSPYDAKEHMLKMIYYIHNNPELKRKALWLALGSPSSIFNQPNHLFHSPSLSDADSKELLRMLRKEITDHGNLLDFELIKILSENTKFMNELRRAAPDLAGEVAGDEPIELPEITTETRLTRHQRR